MGGIKHSTKKHNVLLLSNNQKKACFSRRVDAPLQCSSWTWKTNQERQGVPMLFLIFIFPVKVHDRKRGGIGSDRKIVPEWWRGRALGIENFFGLGRDRFLKGGIYCVFSNYNPKDIIFQLILRGKIWLFFEFLLK